MIRACQHEEFFLFSIEWGAIPVMIMPSFLPEESLSVFLPSEQMPLAMQSRF
jgi:hypothetical protein